MVSVVPSALTIKTFCGAALFADPENVDQAVHAILQDYGTGSGHVFNLGHGIHKDTPIEGVSAMVEAVHRYGVHTPVSDVCGMQS